MPASRGSLADGSAESRLHAKGPDAARTNPVYGAIPVHPTGSYLNSKAGSRRHLSRRHRPGRCSASGVGVRLRSALAIAPSPAGADREVSPRHIPPPHRPVRDIFLRLASLLDRREKTLFLALLVGTFIGALLEMASVGAVPAFVSSLTDPEGLRGNEYAARAFDMFGATTDIEAMRIMGFGLVAIVVVKAVYLTILTWGAARFTFRRQIVIAKRLFAAYLTSPYTFHLQRNSADLLRNTNQDAMVIVSSALVPFMTVALEGLTLLMILGLLLAVEPMASLAAAVVFGGTIVLFTRLIRRRIHQLLLARRP